MKKYLNLSPFAAIVTALTFFACSNDNEPQNEIFEPTPVQFSVGLSGVAQTRAISTTDFFDNLSINGEWVASTTKTSADKIMLYSIDDTKGTSTANLAHYQYYVKSAATANVATLEACDAATNQQFYWMTSAEKKKVVAWSYGRTDDISDITLTSGAMEFDLRLASETSGVVSDQSVTGWNKELLWGYGILDKTSAPYNVNMYHQLARIDLKVTVNNTKQQPEAVYIGRKDATKLISSEELLVLNGSFKPVLDHTVGYTTKADFSASPSFTQGSWSDTDPSSFYGKWDAAGTPVTGYIIPSKYEVTVADGSVKANFETEYSAVVIPHEYTANKLVLFEIKADGVTYVYVPTSTTEFEAGHKYVYEVTVTSTGLSVTATIQPWATGTGGGSGNAELD